MSPSSPGLEDRAFGVWARRRQLPRTAASQLLAATEALTLAALASLARLREGAVHARLLAESRRLRIENAELRSESHILRSRLEKLPPRERPHYSPEARFQILAHIRAYLLPLDQAARRFLVTPQTLHNWLSELRHHPDARTIGSLVRPQPPLRRYADVVRRLVRRMKEAGFGSNRQIAMTLARLGWTASRRSVGRFCRETEAPPTPPEPTKRQTTVYGRYPNHLWLADITRVETVFRIVHLHLAVVLDAFSRMPLQAAVFWSEPSAADVLALVQCAVGIHGAPRHFVSDQGSQFVARELKSYLAQAGVEQRFGALYRHGSIALIERFFRTLKEHLHLSAVVYWRPWSRSDLECRLNSALLRYAYSRPHTALRGRVPAEVFFGIADQRPLLNAAPRGRAGDPEADCSADILFLDPEGTALPILFPSAA